MRGTGCALSSAIAARLALGDGLFDACREAKGQVSRLLESATRAKKLVLPRSCDTGT
jgi:hydroxymethylpyrimidine/phosphomethylpyrimidine kinase